MVKIKLMVGPMLGGRQTLECSGCTKKCGQSLESGRGKKWILLEFPLGIHLQGPSSRDVEVFGVGWRELTQFIIVNIT